MHQLLCVVCGSILLVAVSSEAQEQRGSIMGTFQPTAGEFAALLVQRQVAGVAPAAQGPVAGVAERPEHFLGLDVFVGGAGLSAGNDEDEPAMSGFDVGATFLPRVRWAGISGVFSRTTNEDVPIYHVLAGPQFYIGDPVARWTIRALVGFAHRTGAAPSQTSAELVVGGGLDLLWFLRMQFDYARLNLDGFRKNNTRAFVGAVVPLCFRSCREDCINLSGRPATK